MSRARAAFVDRDGVVNELVPDSLSGAPESPLSVEDVVLIPRAAEALKRLAGAGWLLIGVSNQPAAAKGRVSVEELEAVQARVVELLRLNGAAFDAFRMCLHHPEGIVAELSGSCDCRKPSPGMLLDAGHALGVDLSRSWMIGDTDSDVVAGRSAGCKTVLVEHRGSVHKRGLNSKPDAVVPNLFAATTVLQPAGVGGAS